MNKKRVTRWGALGVAAIALCAGAFAYFTDYASKDLSATAGTLTVELADATTDLTNGLTIMNPGDSNDLKFTVNNTGSKSADIKAVITVKVSQPMSDANHEYKITDNAGTELTGVLSADKTSITYTVNDKILSGTVEKEATEQVDTYYPTSNVYDYQFVMDKDAKNAWQGSTADVKIEVFAKQARNTHEAYPVNSDWTSIVEKQ